MKAILLTSVLFCLSISSADEYDTYAAFAQERSTSAISVTDGITLLGPGFLDEYYKNGENDEHKIAYQVRVVSDDEGSNLGKLIASLNRGDNTTYEACVFRRDSKQLFVRVVGQLNELDESQLPLIPGDIVLLRIPPKQNESEPNAFK